MTLGEMAARCSWAALPLALFFAGYYGAPHLTSAVPWDPSFEIDTKVPCISGFAWIYLLGLVLPVTPTFLLPLSLLPRAAATYCVVIGSAAMIFGLFPSDGRMLRAACVNPDWPLDLVYRFDLATNLFPSLHVALATLTIIWLRHVRSKWSTAIVAVACAQPVTVLLVRQHTFVDVLAGALLAFTAYRLIFPGRSGISIHP